MFSATITGRLARDPEMKQTSAGELCKFSIATDHGFGEKKITTWVSCVVFGKQASRAGEWLFKGGRVCVSGSAYVNEWTNKDGVKVKDLTLDVREFESLDRRDAQRDEQPARRRSAPEAAPLEEEDIPF